MLHDEVMSLKQGVSRLHVRGDWTIRSEEVLGCVEKVRLAMAVQAYPQSVTERAEPYSVPGHDRQA